MLPREAEDALLKLLNHLLCVDDSTAITDMGWAGFEQGGHARNGWALYLAALEENREVEHLFLKLIRSWNKQMGHK